MKISAEQSEMISGFVQVTISFKTDGGGELRPPIKVIVEAKGGSVIVNRVAYMKARDELPESEVELRDALTRMINEP